MKLKAYWQLLVGKKWWALSASLVSLLSLSLLCSTLAVSAQADPGSAAAIRALETDGSGMAMSAKDGPSPQVVQPAAVAVDTAPTTLILTTDTSVFAPSSPDPAGLAYTPKTKYFPDMKSLLITDSEVNERTVGNLSPDPIFTGVNVFRSELDGTQITAPAIISTTLPNTATGYFSNEPTGVAFNPDNGHLFFTDDSGVVALYQLNPGSDEKYNTNDDILITRNASEFGFVDPEGVAYGQGHLYVADGIGNKVYNIDLGSDGAFDGAFGGVPPVGNEVVAVIDTFALGITVIEGVEFDPRTHRLYILGRENIIAETTTDGTLIRYIDISTASPIRAGGLAVAPASTGTGDLHLYIVDRAVDNAADPYENDGKLYELSFPNLTPNNTLPVVDAGLEQAFEIGVTGTITGTAIDDGLPAPPAAVTTLWSQVSGPGTVTFGNAAAAVTTASFDTLGAYGLQLTATDGELTASDIVTITVVPVNQPPLVVAGVDQTVTYPTGVLLDGSVSDDGYPVSPGTMTTAWSMVSGPGTVTFGDPSALVTTASFSMWGVYVLQLTASDGVLTANDTVTIISESANDPPVVNVGILDPIISLPAEATLLGAVADDGLPFGTLTTTWSKFSGPGTVTFGDASAVNTTASFDSPGIYVLQLTADDGQLQSSNYVTITVFESAEEKIFVPSVLK